MTPLYKRPFHSAHFNVLMIHFVVHKLLSFRPFLLIFHSHFRRHFLLHQHFLNHFLLPRLSLYHLRFSRHFPCLLEVLVRHDFQLLSRLFVLDRCWALHLHCWGDLVNSDYYFCQQLLRRVWSPLLCCPNFKN